MLTSNPNNIRYNGTGRIFAGDVGGTALMDFGELENLSFNVAVSNEQMRSNRSADRAVILERETERTGTLAWGARELTEQILSLALLGSDIASANQAAGAADAVSTALEADAHIDLGHVDVFSTKLTGAITGTLAAGDTLTGDASGATGDVAWTATGLVELVNVSGTFEAGEAAELDESNYITISGVSVEDDVVVCDAATPTERYVQGTDYDLDPDYGLIRMLSTGSIVSPAFVSYDYPALDINTFNAMEAAQVQKKIIFVTDGADGGPRYRITFWKVNVSISGDWNLIGDGASLMPFSCTVLKDTTRASGQQYFKVEKIG